LRSRIRFARPLFRQPGDRSPKMREAARRHDQTALVIVGADTSAARERAKIIGRYHCC
jgi:hypothetical protein